MAEITETIGKEIYRALGIETGKFEASFIESALHNRMTETNCSTPDSYLEYVKQNRQEAKALELMLENSYSEFFRNSLTFAVLEKIIFPSLVVEKTTMNKEIRIWSAACAAGQEPYSLAILLEEMNRGRKIPVRYRIFATDKSKIQIQQAREGCFSTFSIGQVSRKRLSQWFDQSSSGNENEPYLIKNQLKRNIEFSVFDLLKESANVPPSSIFGNFDLILCANLLFYYQPAYRSVIINKLAKSLAPGGMLVVGETERTVIQQLGFKEIFFQSGIFSNQK